MDDLVAGEMLELMLEDTCLYEFMRTHDTVDIGTETNLGHVPFCCMVHGIRPNLDFPVVMPVSGYITDMFTFGVYYSSAWDRDPIMMDIVVDHMAFGLTDEFEDVDYRTPRYFQNTFDGFSFGKGVHTFWFYAEDIWGLPAYSDTLEFTILNTPPAAPVLVFAPALPFYDEDLTCGITNFGADIDGDVVTYNYYWTVNGEPVEINAPVLPDAFFNAGDVVSVTVTPSDDEVDGESSTIFVTIYTPEILDVSVAPGEGFRVDVFTYSATYRNLRGIAPSSFLLTIDGGEAVPMVKADEEGEDWIEGELYTFDAIFDAPGLHTFVISTMDAAGHINATPVIEAPFVGNHLPDVPVVTIEADTDPVTSFLFLLSMPKAHLTKTAMK
jgi:hypothetical protein